jgi:hypothetical protein
MYRLLLIGIIISQLQNLSVIYAVEIQILQQKIQQYTNNIFRKCKKMYEYFYPIQKEVIEEKKVVMYEDKYKDKFQLLESNLPPNTNNIIIEQTPVGNVIMFYNSRFEFYADKTIPFRFLETVARKYVVTFQCKNIYVEQTKGKDKKTNQFLYLGKIANYSFLKKIENRVTNKKMDISFKEFKNMKRLSNEN